MSDSRYRPRRHWGRYFVSFDNGGVAPRRHLLDRAAAADLDAARRERPPLVPQPVTRVQPERIVLAYVDGVLYDIAD